MLLNNLGAIVSDILFTHALSKVSSLLCLLQCVLCTCRGSTASPLELAQHSYLLEHTSIEILHCQFQGDTKLKLTHGEVTLPDDVMRDIYHMF